MIASMVPDDCKRLHLAIAVLCPVAHPSTKFGRIDTAADQGADDIMDVLTVNRSIAVVAGGQVASERVDDPRDVGVTDDPKPKAVMH
jgi:hypothetical protein